MLVENNADVNVAEEGTGNTPLHYAMFDPWNREFAELLLSKGASPYARGVGDETPFDLARKREESRTLFQRHLRRH